VKGELLPFNLTLMHPPRGREFFVTVTKDYELFSFDMIEIEDGKWAIVGPAPSWIKKLESELAETIMQNV